MHESVLRDFFSGKATAEQLARDLRGAIRPLSRVSRYIKIKQLARDWRAGAQSGPEVYRYIAIKDMKGTFQLARPMLISCCDAVLAGGLEPGMLQAIGFTLIASDTFDFPPEEDDLFRCVVADWSAPEVNYPLTLENVHRFRRWLLEEEPYPPKPTNAPTGGNIISYLEKRKAWW